MSPRWNAGTTATTRRKSTAASAPGWPATTATCLSTPRPRPGLSAFSTGGSPRATGVNSPPPARRATWPLPCRRWCAGRHFFLSRPAERRLLGRPDPAARIPGAALVPAAALSMDWTGLALLVVWVGALQILLDEGKNLDWFASPTIIGLACVAGLLNFLRTLAGGAGRQRRRHSDGTGAGGDRAAADRAECDAGHQGRSRWRAAWCACSPPPRSGWRRPWPGPSPPGTGGH